MFKINSIFSIYFVCMYLQNLFPLTIYLFPTFLAVVSMFDTSLPAPISLTANDNNLSAFIISWYACFNACVFPKYFKGLIAIYFIFYKQTIKQISKQTSKQTNKQKTSFVFFGFIVCAMFFCSKTHTRHTKELKSTKSNKRKTKKW